MTVWYTAVCEKCRCESPPLFVTFIGRISLYALDEEKQRAAGSWLDEHAFHGVTLRHEDQDLPEGVRCHNHE